ncbi:uncharacterized protein PAC_13521 [Phialocephala subalpina]|uniref:Zn(2)-C6 fungal-type domain-containing protein n=1 Tax=Phialocephala subalpina TaxID=576137 RepID=A0A1L7XF22_9HELO|nr:uncharacterized protein PAC_13521 [Phialocephala subalpina]
MEEQKGTANKIPGPTRRKAICSSCRRRKSKCDSREPQCSTCIAHRSQCLYDKPPSLAYVRSLEAKIEKLLQERDARISGVDDGSEIPDKKLHQKLHNTEPFHRPSEAVGPASPFATRSVDTISELNSPPYHTGDSSRKERRPSEHWVSEISVDSHGGVCYHGPTSSFHEAPTNSSNSNSIEAERLNTVEEESSQEVHRIRHSLVSNAAAQRHLEVMAIENIVGVQTEVSSGTASELLKYHWCWIHPTFQFVYRPAFTRDMALSSHVGPETSYFSETLLKVLLGHCSRFRAQKGESENMAMERLTQQARVSIGMAISQPSSIPVIQALLQQSAREVAFANSSQAWLYSGMAFRMAIDLGIHLPNDKLRGYVQSLTAEDIEIRKRLFWSCYTWDKAISLYCGRMPAFTPLVDTNVPEFMDDFTENESWIPYYGNKEHNPTQPSYPPQRGYMISSFTGMCKLCTILSDIMLEIYGAGPESQDLSSGSQHQLTDSESWIPYYGNKEHNPTQPSYPPQRGYMISSFTEFSFHPDLNISSQIPTYLNCYSTYIAATIAVLQFQLQNETISLPPTDIVPEKLDLKFFLSVLQRSATAMPGLNRSVDIVKRHMQTILDRRAKRYLESLFPANNPYSSSQTSPDHQHPSALADTTSTQDRNQIVQPQADQNFQSFAGFNLEGLPAFPGQNFNVGTDFALDQEITDPEMRATLLGLDPHLTLHHENSDWAYGGFYMGNQIQ